MDAKKKKKNEKKGKKQEKCPPKELHIHYNEDALKFTEDLDCLDLGWTYASEELLKEDIENLEHGSQFAVYKLDRIESIQSNPHLQIEQEFE